MSARKLAEEYEHLAEEHVSCQPEQPDHSCRCFLSPPCDACVDCPAWIEEAWRDGPRWKVACVNWPSKDAPHFMVYLTGNGDHDFARFTYTYAEAWAYIEAIGPRVAEYLRSKK